MGREGEKAAAAKKKKHPKEYVKEIRGDKKERRKERTLKAKERERENENNKKKRVGEGEEKRNVEIVDLPPSIRSMALLKNGRNKQQPSGKNVPTKCASLFILLLLLIIIIIIIIITIIIIISFSIFFVFFSFGDRRLRNATASPSHCLEAIF